VEPNARVTWVRERRCVRDVRCGLSEADEASGVDCRVLRATPVASIKDAIEYYEANHTASRFTHDHFTCMYGEASDWSRSHTSLLDEYEWAVRRGQMAEGTQRKAQRPGGPNQWANVGSVLQSASNIGNQTYEKHV